jgi:hypothetical protein
MAHCEQREREAGARPRLEREHRVRSVPGEDRARTLARERRSRDRVRGAECSAECAHRAAEAELAQQPERRARVEWERRQNERLNRAPAGGERPDQAPVGVRISPELRRRLVDAPRDERRLVVVERMRETGRRLDPLEVEVERAEARGRAAERVDRRADVVQEARQRQLVGSQAAADLRSRLVHDDVDACARERDRGGKPVRPRSDDDGATGQRAAPARAQR